MTGGGGHPSRHPLSIHPNPPAVANAPGCSLTPGHAARADPGQRTWAGVPLPGSRGGRAGVHRGAAARSATPGRDSAAARRAELLHRRGRGHARNQPDRHQGLPATRPRVTRATPVPAFGCYLAGAGKPIWQLTGLLVLTVSGDRISAITRSSTRTCHDDSDSPKRWPIRRIAPCRVRSSRRCSEYGDRRPRPQELALP